MDKEEKLRLETKRVGLINDLIENTDKLEQGFIDRVQEIPSR